MRFQKNGRILLAVAFILLIIIAISIAVVSYYQQFSGYNRKSRYLSTDGYAAVIGCKEFYEKEILTRCGDPESRARWVDSEKNDRTLILDQYEKFDVLYVYTDWYKGEPYNTLLYVIFKHESLRFGRMKIGIGSTKEEVHLAYAKEPMVDAEEIAYSAEDYPDVDEGYYGEDWSRILFCYDDAGRVISMAYQPPAF